MQLRNSLLSVRRSPLKSILFFILIFALTVVLMLGSTLVNTCLQTINKCKETYVTTATLEYQSGLYPNQDIRDPSAVALQDAIDFDALEQKPYILQAEKTQNAGVFIGGFENIKDNMPAKTAVVLEVSVNSFNVEGQLLATVKNVLYSSTIQPGRTVFLNMPQEEDGSNAYLTPESGKRYLLCGVSDGAPTGHSGISVMPILPRAAVDADLSLSVPIVELTDEGYSVEDPRFTMFYRIAEAYEKINNCRYATLATQPAMLEAFSQNDYILKSGKLYTPEECADGTVRCLLPEVIASRLKLSVGDTVPIDVFTTDAYSLSDAYFPDVTAMQTIPCLVSGIYSSSNEDLPRVFMSSFGDVPAGLAGYTIGTLRLENGVRTLPQGLLPSDITVTVYDQGYAGVYHALSELLTGALRLLLLAAIVALALLLLFAFLFVSRQADALQTMYMLGTSRAALCRYTLYGTGAILLPAVLIACPVSKQFTALLNDIFQRSTAITFDTTAFSTTGLGVIKPLTASVQMPLLLLLGCAACVLLVGLLLCLCFLLPILRIKKQKREKKQRRHNTAPRERKTSLLRGAGRKYLLLSVRRGGVRSVVVPVICLLLAVFLLALSYTEQVYREKRVQLDKDTEITGYFSDYSGKFRGNLLLPERMFDKFTSCDLFTETVFYSQASYCFMGQITKSDGSVVYSEGGTAIIPNNSFAYESFIERFLSGPKIIYTPNLMATGGFEQEGKNSVTWLDGYGEHYFTEEREAFTGLRELNFWSYSYETFDEDLREFCCVVPRKFLEKYGAELGDTLFLFVGTEAEATNLSYKIIGCYESKNADGNFYTRLDNEPLVAHVWFGLDEEDFFPAISHRNAYSGGTFRLADASRLQEAKDTLDELGYSRTRKTARFRIYPVFEDSEYLNAAEKLDSSVAFIGRMRIIATILSFFCGATAAYLMASRRKTELAVLRSLGAKRRTAFFVFFGEQTLLCLGGTVLGLLLWRLVAPWSLQSLFAFTFALGYLLATAAALLRANYTDLLSILSEKE